MSELLCNWRPRWGETAAWSNVEVQPPAGHASVGEIEVAPQMMVKPPPEAARGSTTASEMMAG